MNVFYRFNHDKMKQKIQIQRYASPCGGLWLGSLGDQLCLCNWTNEKHPGRVDKRLQTLLKAEYEEAPSDVTQEAIRQLDEYFTISYGAMAKRLGIPKAVRAVANANGANAISIFAPCHRVVGSDGSLTGFGGGIEAKRFLLALEQDKLGCFCRLR